MLERIKAEIGSLQFSAQYQQRPGPLEGNLIKWEWFRWYDRLPPARSGDRVVQSWDTALMTGSGNDFSVCTTWRMVGRDYYLIDVYRVRQHYPDLRRAAAALAARHQVEAVLIEDAGPGMAMLQDLQHDLLDGMPRPIGIKPQGSKIDRMAAQSSRIEAGQVHLPSDAPWLDEYLSELLAFPYGRHDDQVDSTSQFLNDSDMGCSSVSKDPFGY